MLDKDMRHEWLKELVEENILLKKRINDPRPRNLTMSHLEIADLE